MLWQGPLFITIPSHLASPPPLLPLHLILWNRVSLCSSAWFCFVLMIMPMHTLPRWIHYVAQTDPKLAEIYLPLPPGTKGVHSRYVPPNCVYHAHSSSFLQPPGYHHSVTSTGGFPEGRNCQKTTLCLFPIGHVIWMCDFWGWCPCDISLSLEYFAEFAFFWNDSTRVSPSVTIHGCWAWLSQYSNKLRN